jgi:hypothetical protein
VAFLKYSRPLLKLTLTLPGLMASLFLFTMAAHAQSAALLPDAPQPRRMRAAQPAPSSAGQTVPPGTPQPGAAGSVDHASYQKRKWAQYVDPGEHVPRLTAKDKMEFWLHQEARISSAFPAFLSAGYGQLADSPRYGSDSGAFGDRLGAAILRQATMRFFCSSAFPTIDGEDPRYFRKASGSYVGRAGWAAEQAIVAHRDSGRRSFNVSDVFGHLAAAALTPLYYPAPSATTGVVLQTWGTSIAGAAANNLFLEFWPDVTNKLHRLRH